MALQIEIRSTTTKNTLARMRNTGARPGIPTSIADISCQRPTLQAAYPWGHSHHITSVTARWPIVKGVLSK